MMKRLLIAVSVLLVMAVLALVTVAFGNRSVDQPCQEVLINLVDTKSASFINEPEIRQLLTDKGVKLEGKSLSSIDYAAVEQLVNQHRLVQRAECYPCPSGIVRIAIWQHVPVMRIFSEGKSYYIDTEGYKTGLSTLTAANVPVATGAIHDSLTIADLYKMAGLLKQDARLDALIEQIVVNANGEWVLIPRLGDFELHVGQPVNLEVKLKRLSVFLSKYLPKIGWNTYSVISVKYDNQIVCTRKET